MDELTKEKWRRLRERPDDIALRNELAESVFHVCEIQCNRILKRIGDRRLCFEELMSIAYETLLDRLTTFDPDYGVEPSTFLSRRIWGALIDHLRDGACETTSRLKQRRNRIIDQWIATLDHQPNEEEIFEHFGFSRVHREVYSIDQKYETEFGGTVLSNVLADLLSDRRCTNDQSLPDELVRSCNLKERHLLIGYYIEGMSMKEVGESLGLSESRVSQMHSSMINRFRERMEVPSMVTSIRMRSNNGAKRGRPSKRERRTAA